MIFAAASTRGIAFCEDCRPLDYPRAMLREAISEGKRLRRYFTGDFYALTPVTTDAHDWCAYQWHRPEEADGVVYAFRRQEAPHSDCELRLRQIDPKAQYDVEVSLGYARAQTQRMSGKALVAPDRFGDGRTGFRSRRVPSRAVRPRPRGPRARCQRRLPPRPPFLVLRA